MAHGVERHASRANQRLWVKWRVSKVLFCYLGLISSWPTQRQWIIKKEGVLCDAMQVWGLGAAYIVRNENLSDLRKQRQYGTLFCQ